MPMHIIMHAYVNVKFESTEILEITFFWFIFLDSCHRPKDMLLESLTIPFSKMLQPDKLMS